MKKTGTHNRKRVFRSVLVFMAALSLCLSPAFASYADITSDVPQISNEPTISDLPDLSDVNNIGGGSSSGTSTSTSSGTSSGGTSSGTSGKSSGAVIGDDPDLGGTAVAKPADTEKETESHELAKDETELSDLPSASGKSTNGTINSAPVTGKTSAASEAPVAETKAAEETKPVSTESTDASVAIGPSSQKSTSGGIGSVYANDAVTRVNLDFSLITPNHTKGSLHVARGCIKLSDGSWQTFDYKDNIHYAFFKQKDTQTDSSGTTWYIATVKARRFGDASAKDGEFKTELWLNAADCITRSTIDVNTTNEKRIAIVKAALSLLGKQYIYGSNGPDAYDCSGLVKYVCKQAGITVPRTSTQLLQMSGQITAAELRPGDILARAGHCGIYIGNGIFVHASDSSVGVVAEYLSVYNLSNKFTNYINVVGD